jgi:oligogalacturonide transport system permease protein
MNNKNNKFKKWSSYILLTLVGIVFTYPLIWLFFSSFKKNDEIFGSISLFPKAWVWTAYRDGWQGSGQADFGLFFANTFKIVIPVVIFTVLSCSIVAYGFARFTFPLKKILFALMLSTLMLPNAVIIIPRFILFRNLNWINTYYPFIVPAIFAVYPFFIFMLVQFFRGLPRELDESAIIDGCGALGILFRILIPLSKPALFSAAVFQFIWTWNDFLGVMVYINSVSKYTLALGLRMSVDVVDAVSWNNVMAMSVVTIVPCVLLFFFAQKYFVEGIATTGLKA